MIRSEAPELLSHAAGRDGDPNSDEARGTGKRGLFVSRLIERYRDPLLRHLTGLLSRPEDAEDVLQETCRRLLDAPHLDPRSGRAPAYMFKIATHLAYDRFRARRLESFEADGYEATLASATHEPDLIVGFDQGLEIVKRTVLELKPRCRRVFLLRIAEGMPYEAIADVLGISKRTVEREMKHALDACQRRLKR
jgi:RNA polymerase sigma factor (sigma-70 family)